MRNQRNDQFRDDRWLIKKYRQSGDSHYVAELMQRYAPNIMAFGLKKLRNREDVKDFTNDVFLKLCDKLQSEEIHHFKSWLYRFMTNLFLDRKRHEKVHEHFVRSIQPAADYAIDAKLQAELDRKHIRQALNQLEKNERICVELLYMQGKSYREIGQETGWTFNQIRGLRDRAKKKLKEIMSPELKELNS